MTAREAGPAQKVMGWRKWTIDDAGWQNRADEATAPLAICRAALAAIGARALEA